jgi:hypothetical protein
MPGQIYTEPIIKQALSAGWGPISYRQNTELRMPKESISVLRGAVEG